MRPGAYARKEHLKGKLYLILKTRHKQLSGSLSLYIIVPALTPSALTLCVIMLSVVMLSVVMLSVVMPSDIRLRDIIPKGTMLSVIILCQYTECLYIECHFAECSYAEWYYAEWRYAKCRGAILRAINVSMNCDEVKKGSRPTVTKRRLIGAITFRQRAILPTRHFVYQQ